MTFSGVRKENVATSILVIPTTVASPSRRVYSRYDAGGSVVNLHYLIKEILMCNFSDNCCFLIIINENYKNVLKL